MVGHGMGMYVIFAIWADKGNRKTTDPCCQLCSVVVQGATQEGKRRNLLKVICLGDTICVNFQFSWNVFILIRPVRLALLMCYQPNLQILHLFPSSLWSFVCHLPLPFWGKYGHAMQHPAVYHLQMWGVWQRLPWHHDPSYQIPLQPLSPVCANCLWPQTQVSPREQDKPPTLELTVLRIIVLKGPLRKYYWSRGMISKGDLDKS